MITRQRNPAAAYRNVGLETQMDSATPHQLILMLFDGAQLSIANAQHHMTAGNIAEKGLAISRAIDIISSGLQASLNLDSGGELAGRLEALYEYMGSRLLHANLHNDVGALKEVGQLLADLRSAWEEISDDPAVLSRTGTTTP